MRTNEINYEYPQRTDTLVLDGNEALSAYGVVAQPIGKEAVQKATQILQKYKEGKANLEARIIGNEQWYKLRHWQQMSKSKGSSVEPVSAWLFNCIQNKHADAMDNFPTPNILPREEGDKEEARKLSSIIPVILDQCDFEGVYDETWLYKLKQGTGVYGVFWDAEKHGGLGDVSIKKMDLLSLFWEPGITDIQDSKHMFSVELWDNETLVGTYPELSGKLGSSTLTVEKYVYDDTVDTSDKSAVVDWYYRKTNSEGKAVLHYVKYVNDVVLYATENDEDTRETGLYDHGKYPFVLDTLFKVEGTPCGFGYIDIGKSTQEYIDKVNQAILQNTLVNARPRFFIRNDGGVNETEYADATNELVHVEGNLDNNSIQPVQTSQLAGIYVTVLQEKIDELKETTGNRDVTQGGTSGGATAASAIAAMQEAGSKLSRDAQKSAYRAFREICNLVIELIRQFYDLPRQFRIVGERGAMEFVQYSNAGIRPQDQGADFGVDMGLRLPVFDIEVSAQKASPYSKLSQNELALQFYQLGFFNPQLSDQALAVLDMMDFDRKDFVAQKISENGTMYQMIIQMQQ
ncbi:MAG: hypothetical protein IKR26_04520, partial [Lachnospiraceae bacterium]|nr:hypothetical protein [Lachnospiraceae bacterium]